MLALGTTFVVEVIHRLNDKTRATLPRQYLTDFSMPGAVMLRILTECVKITLGILSKLVTSMHPNTPTNRHH